MVARCLRRHWICFCVGSESQFRQTLVSCWNLYYFFRRNIPALAHGHHNLSALVTRSICSWPGTGKGIQFFAKNKNKNERLCSGKECDTCPVLLLLYEHRLFYSCCD